MLSGAAALSGLSDAVRMSLADSSTAGIPAAFCLLVLLQVRRLHTHLYHVERTTYESPQQSREGPVGKRSVIAVRVQVLEECEFKRPLDKQSYERHSRAAVK